MAINYLETNTETSNIKGDPVYSITKQQNGAGTPGPIMLPDEAGKKENWNVGISPVTSGTARMEYTLSDRDAVKNGAGKWRRSTAGNVTLITDAIFGNPTAVRLYVVSGDWKIEVRV